MVMSISQFQVIRPRFEMEQTASLEWLAKAHAHADATFTGKEDPDLYATLKQKLLKLGCNQETIARRGIQINDLFQDDWSTMQVYPLNDQPLGSGFGTRSAVFDREVSSIFENFYPEKSPFPDHIIHVTCTGYTAPSPAQKIVSKREQGKNTTVTHAYHMGCYASFPALRIAKGFLSCEEGSVDIVHTELSSLHMHPLKHSLEQLIIQSLFADGFIKYSVTCTPPKETPFLQIIALYEEIIPKSTQSMSWCCDDRGLSMTLAKEVPFLIVKMLPDHLKKLFNKAQLAESTPCFYAIHPGGPKILSQIQSLLNLSEEGIYHSKEIFRSCGNMSSATLPHIWNLMLSDLNVPFGAYIVSLAFGPGLSISGGVFKKSRG